MTPAGDEQALTAEIDLGARWTRPDAVGRGYLVPWCQQSVRV